jgi:hypothetical protein
MEQDLPYAYSIKKFTGSSYLGDSNYHDLNLTQQNKLTENYGNPKIVKFPSINKRLELLNPIVKNGEFLARTNKAHTMTDKNGNMVVYMLRSWQTIESFDGAVVGDNVFLDTEKGWRYVYRIDEIGEADIDSKIVLPSSESPQLLIIVEDTKNGKNAVLRCQYMTVVNIQR